MNLQAYLKLMVQIAVINFLHIVKWHSSLLKKINIGLYGSQNMSMFWLKKLQTNKVS